MKLIEFFYKHNLATAGVANPAGPISLSSTEYRLVNLTIKTPPSLFFQFIFKNKGGWDFCTLLEKGCEIKSSLGSQ